MKYSIRLAAKDDYDRIGRLYEKAFDHSEGLVKYYTGFDEYLSFFVAKNNAFVVEEDNIVAALY